MVYPESLGVIMAAGFPCDYPGEFGVHSGFGESDKLYKLIKRPNAEP